MTRAQGDRQAQKCRRVVLLVTQFPKLSETFILNKVLELLERGWDAHVVCWASPAREWHQVQGAAGRQELRTRVHVSWPHRPRWLALLLMPLAVLRCLVHAPSRTLQYLRRGYQRFGLDVFRRLYLDAEIVLLEPDLLHIEFGALAPERMYLKELLDCKVLVSFRGYDLNFVRLEDPGYYRPVWDSADGLHLLGGDLWRRAQKRGCPPEKAHTLIPPAIDTDFFTPPERALQNEVGTPARPLRILSVGRLEWKKGYEYGFEAVRLLIGQGVACEYRVIGDGEYYEACSFAIHQMGLKETVHLLGSQPRESVREQMAWADVFLHPSLSEGFCNAVLEAQAMGLPVVCSDAGSLPENVMHGATGFVVPRRCPNALADKLSLLSCDPSAGLRMGNAGRQRVVQHFQVSNQLDKFERLSRGLLEAREGNA